MTAYLYLIRNGDLYKIGTTKSLEKQIKVLNPDEIIKTFRTDYPEALEARLFRRYKKNRIPDSNYFRLTSDQLEDCKKQLGEKGFLPLSLEKEFNIGLSGSILLALFGLFLPLYFGQSIFNCLIISLIASSFPMWTLFILGNFGGYDINDLSLFSSWANRVKALLFALVLSLSSYYLWLIIN
tara:strand:+ start:1064 stop:1609 length:546 start_codon:yes stop_codon:yes gene_type:complete